MNRNTTNNITLISKLYNKINKTSNNFNNNNQLKILKNQFGMIDDKYE